MTRDREKEMLKASQLYPKHQQKVFVDGALWSDKHPSPEWIDKAFNFLIERYENQGVILLDDIYELKSINNGGTKMTDKQKRAVKILNGLWNANGGLMKLSEEEYFLLLECVLGGEENTKWISRTILPNVPTLQCYEPNGVCTNPFHDCINCPKIHGGGTGTFTSTNIKDK